MRNLLLGIDLGSSSVKGSLLDSDSGHTLVSRTLPDEEMPMASPHAGWAEQDPERWWTYVQDVCKSMVAAAQVQKGELKGIGIAYQMHGLVLVDSDQQVLRSSIIWCDSRAVDIGEEAFRNLGKEYCLTHFLNSPGNFTASKLRWVLENQPELASKIHKVMLPGDFIGMRLTGEILTSETGLSEGIFWDYENNGLSERLLEYYQIDKNWIPDSVPSFSIQGKVSKEAAALTGLEAGVPVSYRAGDQPNNAFSLQVLKPGELATTAGTSGTVFGVSEKPVYDPHSRVNTFIHVNHQQHRPSYGVLLCLNGAGILNSWMRRLLGPDLPSYEFMNQAASAVGIGSGGLVFLPFGNGAERMLQNKQVGAHLMGLDLLRHGQAQVLRATQEGVAAALTHGFLILRNMGLTMNTVKAGRANMFLSPVFREAFIHMNQVELQFMDTDGAQGAARGAGIGAGIFSTEEEAFRGLELLETLEPNKQLLEPYEAFFNRWQEGLEQIQKN